MPAEPISPQSYLPTYSISVVMEPSGYHPTATARPNAERRARC